MSSPTVLGQQQTSKNVAFNRGKLAAYHKLQVSMSSPFVIFQLLTLR